MGSAGLTPSKRGQRSSSDSTAEHTANKRGRRPSTICGVNNHVWYTTARQRVSNRQNPIRSYLPGPVGEARNVKTPFEAWSLLINETMIRKIVQHTNEEMSRYHETAQLDMDISSNVVYRNVDELELRAYIGLLYYSGLQKTSKTNIKDLWDEFGGSPVYRATMSLNRFAFISKCIRFDDKSTRVERKELDKFAPIREL